MSNRPAETMLPPAYGARNEASVLFRVDQLAGAPLSARSAGKPPVAEPSAPVISSIPGDDEGVIDLKSLSSAPPGLGAGPLGRRAPVVVAPLFSEPPAMTLEVDDARALVKPISRGKLAAAAAGALALMIVLGFGISLVFRGEERKPVAAALPPPPPPPAAVTAPAPTANADAPKVSTDEGPAEETPKKNKRRKGGAKMASGVGGSMKTAGSKPKAADPCGCHGEFNCILACSAKGKM